MNIRLQLNGRTNKIPHLTHHSSLLHGVAVVRVIELQEILLIAMLPQLPDLIIELGDFSLMALLRNIHVLPNLLVEVGLHVGIRVLHVYIVFLIYNERYL